MIDRAGRTSSLVYLCIALAGLHGCYSLPEIETTIYDSPRSSVTLRVLHDQADKADHPITLHPSVLQSLLRGIRVVEQQALLQGLISEETGPLRVWSEDDIQFLLPHLRTALSQATADEAVRIRLNYEEGGEKTQTTGSILVRKGNIHLTLYNFRTSQRNSLQARSSYGKSRPKVWTLWYLPERHQTDHSLRQQEDGLPASIIVPLAMLRESPPIDPASLQTPPRTTTSPQVGDRKKETLRQEIEQLRQSIRNQELQLKRLEERMVPKGSAQTP